MFDRVFQCVSPSLKFVSLSLNVYLNVFQCVSPSSNIFECVKCKLTVGLSTSLGGEELVL